MNPEPTIETRDQQSYLAIPVRLTQPEISNHVDKLFPELFQWLGAHRIEWRGVPFIRYRGMDNEGVMDMEIGVPVDAGSEGDDRVKAGTFPAGRYAKLVHRGHYSGLKEAHMALQDWIIANGHRFTKSETDGVVKWGNVTEFYPTNPMEEPDPANWITEILFLLE